MKLNYWNWVGVLENIPPLGRGEEWILSGTVHNLWLQGKISTQLHILTNSIHSLQSITNPLAKTVSKFATEFESEKVHA